MRPCYKPDALFFQPAQARDVHTNVFPAVYPRRYAVRQPPRSRRPWRNRRRALEREDELEQHGCTCQILKGLGFRVQGLGLCAYARAARLRMSNSWSLQWLYTSNKRLIKINSGVYKATT